MWERRENRACCLPLWMANNKLNKGAECFFLFLPPKLTVNRRLCLVATVGYIVGLGDRHIQNILIDEQTAELVHIDLGTAS